MLTGEFSGEWWLPSEPSRRLGGFLRLEAGQQPRLHLAGQLSDLELRFGSRAVEHPAILGITALGKPVTIVRAIESGGQTNLFAPGSGDTIVTAPRVYVGDHFRREDAAMFRRMDLRLGQLDTWFPPPLIRQEIETRRGRLEQVVLTLRAGRPVRTRMAFGRLTFGHAANATGNRRTEAWLGQSASIVATTDRRQPLTWWLATVVKPLRYLLSISTELPILVETLRLRPWTTKTDDEVEVVWANEVPTVEHRDLHPSEMLLWYGDLEGRFETALRHWFSAVDDLAPVLDQFFATYNTARSFVETRFTMTVGAAEAYHRERIGGTDVDAPTHRERIRQARAGVDPMHLDWLNGRLNNKKTLVRRLVELCGLVPEVSEIVVGSKPEAFARAVVDARNLRTHLDFSRVTAPESRGLIVLTSQLGVILEAALLCRELGLRSSDVAQRVERASRLRRLAVETSRD
jgi:hypothetical protein